MIMGTQFKDVDFNMEDSGNSCGSSVVSDLSGSLDQAEFFDADGLQVSDLEENGDTQDVLSLTQVLCLFYTYYSSNVSYLSYKTSLWVFRFFNIR